MVQTMTYERCPMSCLSSAQDGFQGSHTPCVLGRRPDADSQVRGEAVPRHGTDDNPVPEEGIRGRRTRPAHLHQEEIRHARYDRETQGPALFREVFSAHLCDRSGASHVVLVAERGRRGRLGQAVGIERFSNPVEQGNERRGPDPG